MKYLILLLVCLESGIAKLNQEWWKHTSIYQIIPFAYKDSNGDGIGDIKGITSKLDYLQNLGIEVVYLSPFYKTGHLDMGFDIIDFQDIDEKFGTMADFEEFIRELKKRGMKLMIELIMNHSSDKHPWFLKSVNKIDPYTDYYVWKDPSYYEGENNTPHPPNQWKNWFGGGLAWEWNEQRKQFYYHAFLPQQPDLNLRNEKVKNEIKNIIKFWMDKGVDGFRIDAGLDLIEDKYLSNSGQRGQKESFEFIHEMRTFIDNYNQKHGGYERFVTVETYGSAQFIAAYYGTKDYHIVHFPLCYVFRWNFGEFDSSQLNNMIKSWLGFIPEGETTAWVADDHDGPRSGSRIRTEYIDINLIATAMLPGIVHYYYGVEIGLTDGIVKRNQGKDLSGEGRRDPNRLLMQWDNSLNAGFSRHIGTHVPPSMSYSRINVKEQENNEISHLSLVKNLNRLRKTKTLKEGKFTGIVHSPSIYIFYRSIPKHETYIVIFNLKDYDSDVDLKQHFKNLPETLLVEAASVNSGYKKGQMVAGNKNDIIIMKPKSAIVVNGAHHLNQRS